MCVAANRAAFDGGRLAAHQPDALEDAAARAQVVQLHVPETFERAVARRIEPDRLPGRGLRPDVPGKPSKPWRPASAN